MSIARLLSAVCDRFSCCVVELLKCYPLPGGTTPWEGFGQYARPDARHCELILPRQMSMDSHIREPELPSSEESLQPTRTIQIPRKIADDFLDWLTQFFFSKSG